MGTTGKKVWKPLQAYVVLAPMMIRHFSLTQYADDVSIILIYNIYVQTCATEYENTVFFSSLTLHRPLSFTSHVYVRKIHGVPTTTISLILKS